MVLPIFYIRTPTKHCKPLITTVTWPVSIRPQQPLPPPLTILLICSIHRTSTAVKDRAASATATLRGEPASVRSDPTATVRLRRITPTLQGGPTTPIPIPIPIPIPVPTPPEDTHLRRLRDALVDRRRPP